MSDIRVGDRGHRVWGSEKVEVVAVLGEYLWVVFSSRPQSPFTIEAKYFIKEEPKWEVGKSYSNSVTAYKVVHVFDNGDAVVVWHESYGARSAVYIASRRSEYTEVKGD